MLLYLTVIIEKSVVDGFGFAPSDLVPREAVEKWLKYLREELPTVAFKCSTQEQKSNLGWKSGPKAGKEGRAGKTGNSSNLLQTSDCLGAETLIKLLKNYSRSHEVIENLSCIICLDLNLSPSLLLIFPIAVFLCAEICEHSCQFTTTLITYLWYHLFCELLCR